jgi:hypothetical protein
LVEHLDSLEYPDNWRELAHQIRIRDGFTCQRCGRRDLPLHVHHVNGRSHDPSNLQTICEECHFDEHPHLRAAAEARGRSDDDYLHWKPAVRPKEFTEMKLREREIAHLEMQRTAKPPLLWRFLGWIRPKAVCPICGREKKLARDGPKWTCRECRENIIKMAILRRQREIHRLKRVAEKRYVSPPVDSVGAIELRTRLELERSSR